MMSLPMKWTCSVSSADRNCSKVLASPFAFLRGSAAAGGALVIGLHLARDGARAAGGPDLSKAPAKPNAFVRIAADDTVSVVIKHLDMGQGNTTGLATIVAEELDADWAQMRAVFAPADASLYNNLAFGPIQGTGGSTAIANSWFQLRKAGAAARAMLVAAAAQEWKVPAAEITIEKGVLRHASGKEGRFGAFAAKAAVQPIPENPTLKDPSAFRLIGTRLPRLDSNAKTDGSAVYALDVRRPGQLTALVARAPRFGATVKSVDDDAARAVPGVVQVVRIPSGVAVVARDTWSAMKGREALTVTWDDTGAERQSTESQQAAYKAMAAKPGLVASKRGDAAGGIKGAAKVLEAEFNFPYLAHAPMEPLNATIERAADGSYDIYAGSQFQTIEQAVAAGILGTTADKIRITTLWAGGSFQNTRPPFEGAVVRFPQSEWEQPAR